MRLARKLAFAFLIGVIMVMGANAYLQVRRERALFERDAVRDQHLLGRTLRVGVETFWPIYGEAAARRLIRHAVERGELRVRWVHLNVLPGDPDRPRAMGADLSAVAAGRELSLVAPYRRGQERRFTYVPVIIDGQVRGALEVSESTIDERQFSRVSTLQIIGATLAIVGLCGLIAIMVGVWIVGRPMRTLCEKARRVGEGDLSGPLAVAQHDEIGELAGEINSMCDHLSAARQEIATATEARIATLEQLRHADRLKTVGQLASGIAHELGTPLNVVAGRAKLILRATSRRTRSDGVPASSSSRPTG